MIVARIKEISLNYKAESVLTFAVVTAIRKEIEKINPDARYAALVAADMAEAQRIFGERLLQNEVLALGSPNLEYVLRYDDVDKTGFFNPNLDIKTSSAFLV